MGLVLTPRQNILFSVDYWRIKVKEYVGGDPVLQVPHLPQHGRPVLLLAHPSRCQWLAVHRQRRRDACRVTGTALNTGSYGNSGVDFEGRYVGISISWRQKRALTFSFTGSLALDNPIKSNPPPPRSIAPASTAGLFEPRADIARAALAPPVPYYLGAPPRLELSLNWRHIGTMKSESTNPNPNLSDPAEVLPSIRISPPMTTSTRRPHGGDRARQRAPGYRRPHQQAAARWFAWIASPQLINGNMVASMYDTLGDTCSPECGEVLKQRSQSRARCARRGFSLGVIARLLSFGATLAAVAIRKGRYPHEIYLPLAGCCALALGLLITAWAADQGLAWPTLAETIEIPQSAGKFDFLRIDSKRGRLLAAHENDGTSDFVDLKKNTLITRVKVGGPVDTAMDGDSKFYYVSVQEPERVAVLDAETLKEVKSIKTPGPTDAIIYEPKNHMVYVTHDNGGDVWVIDPAVRRWWRPSPSPVCRSSWCTMRKRRSIYWTSKPRTRSRSSIRQTTKSRPNGPPRRHAAPWLGLRCRQSSDLAAGGNGKLVVVDTKTGSATGSIDIVPKVDQIAFDTAGELLYCAGADKMSVFARPAAKRVLGGFTHGRNGQERRGRSADPRGMDHLHRRKEFVRQIMDTPDRDNAVPWRRPGEAYENTHRRRSVPHRHLLKQALQERSYGVTWVRPAARPATRCASQL